MNFSNIKDWTIYEGSVIRVTDSLGRVIWEKDSKSYYITAVYYPITNTTTTQILASTSGVSLIEYNNTEYTPRTYLKFNSKLADQTIKIYLTSPSVNVYTLFQDVDRVKTITIGKDINNVYKDNLSYGHYVWFRSAFVESGNSTYDSRGYGIVHTSTNTLVVGGSETTFDSTVTGIGKCSLACVARGTDGSQKSSSDTSMPNSGVTLWDIPGNTCTSLGEKAFWGTRIIGRLNLRGYRLRQNQDIPTNAFTSFGDDNSTIHIPTGTSLANTVWLNGLVTTRQTGYKWTVCADL